MKFHQTHSVFEGSF